MPKKNLGMLKFSTKIDPGKWMNYDDIQHLFSHLKIKKKNGVPVVKIAEKSHLQAAGLWKLKPPEEFREPPGHGCHGPQPQQGFITMFRIKMAMSFRGPIPHFQRQVANFSGFFPGQLELDIRFLDGRATREPFQEHT